jgi:hypothetical protein
VRIHRLALKGEDTEDAFVDAPKRFPQDESLQCFDANGEFTECQERLVETDRLRRRSKFSGSKYSGP